MADKDINNENINNDANVSDFVIDDNLKEILKKIQKNKEMSKEEIEKLKKQALESTNFVEKIESINLNFDKYVVFTDGNEQLIYEDGEFFVVSSTDINQKKEKKKKEEAKNMYIEYFIRYVLNPIIKQREINEHSKGIDRSNVNRELKEKLKKRLKDKNVKEKDIGAKDENTDTKEKRYIGRRVKEEKER